MKSGKKKRSCKKLIKKEGIKICDEIAPGDPGDTPEPISFYCPKSCEECTKE